MGSARAKTWKTVSPPCVPTSAVVRFAHAQDAADWFRLAIQAKHAGDPERAILYYEYALVVDPDTLAARFNLGLLLKSEGDYDQAGQMFASILKRDARHLKSYIMLGNLLYLNRQYEEAHQYYVRATTLQPTSAIAFRNLGMVCRRLGLNKESHDADERADALERTTSTNPGNPKIAVPPAKSFPEFDPRDVSMCGLRFIREEGKTERPENKEKNAG